MDKKKIILILMIIIIILIIVLVSILLIRKRQQTKTIENQRDELITLLTEKVTKVENRDQFFAINSHIKKYFDYKKQNDIEALKAISGDTIIDNDNFQSREMYLLNKITNYTVYIYGKIKQQNAYVDEYLIINLDYGNYTFSIEVSSKQEFENAKNNRVQKKYKENIIIQKNLYNEIILAEKANDFQVLKEYFEDYKFKAIYYPEQAFTLIEEKYKKEKFNNNLEQYKIYLKNNLETFQDANIVKHEVKNENGQIKYTFVDNYNRYYELQETGIYEYTIILDNYTVQSKEQKEKYEGLSNEQKVLSNMDKIMKLINSKDYQTVYQYLNVDFKNTNFPTIETFTTYMQANFFENNVVGKIATRKEGNIYFLKVPYKESLSSAAEEGEKIFMMKLKEGTNFELSFEI